MPPHAPEIAASWILGTSPRTTNRLSSVGGTTPTLQVNQSWRPVMRNFHFPGRSPVVARNAMCATVASAGQPDGDRDAEGRRQCGRCRDRGLRRAVRGRAGDDRHRRRLLRHARQARRAADRAQRPGRAPQAATAEWYAGHGITAIETTSPHAVTRARRHRRLDAAAQGPRHAAARPAADAGDRVRRGRLRGRRRASRSTGRAGGQARAASRRAKQHFLPGGRARRGRAR